LLLDNFDRLEAITRFADQFEARLGFQERLETFAHQLVILNQGDSNGAGGSCHLKQTE
jgi:hypothetical protein